MATADKPGTGKAKVKWAYFGKQKGASGVLRDLGWVKVGSAKWKSYIHPASGQKPGQHRAALVPRRYAVTGGKNPALIRAAAAARPGSGGGVGTGGARGKTGVTQPSGKTPRQAPGTKGAAKKALAKTNPGTVPKNPPKTKLPAIPNGAKTGTIIPRSMAAKMAALQFAPQIATTKADIAQGNVQAAQDLHDISQWYGAANAQSQQGQAASQAQAQQGAQSDQNTTSALLAAIGGGANAGAGQVAAAGQSASALQNALATIGGQGAANMSTAISGASAGASAAQQALNNQAATALQQQLTSLQGQQGDAQASALMQIIQANNATLQQRFSNKLSSLSAAESIDMLPGQLGLQKQQIAQAKLATKADAKTSTSGHIDWANLTPDIQLKLAQSWMVGSKGGTSTYVPMAVAQARARAQGYTAPQVQSFLQAQYAGISN